MSHRFTDPPLHVKQLVLVALCYLSVPVHVAFDASVIVECPIIAIIRIHILEHLREVSLPAVARSPTVTELLELVELNEWVGARWWGDSAIVSPCAGPGPRWIEAPGANTRGADELIERKVELGGGGCKI